MTRALFPKISDFLTWKAIVMRFTTYLGGPTPRRLVAAAWPPRFFWLYIYILECHRDLHANFQKHWPKKKPSFFQLKICCILFVPPCTLHQCPPYTVALGPNIVTDLTNWERFLCFSAFEKFIGLFLLFFRSMCAAARPCLQRCLLFRVWESKWFMDYGCTF